jgi:serine/threonine protein phosphatase PrpC
VIPNERAHLYVAAITHPGMSGKNNEDSYSVSAFTLSETDPTASVFAIVADGVGGHSAGEVASEIAVETICRIVAESDGTNPKEVLEYGIKQASQAIYTESNTDDSKKGMGSTCGCVWVIDNRLFTASVGDSRIYLIRDGQIRQITTDHTWVQEAIEHKIITPEQAKGHPRSHVIRRYLGSSKPVDPDFRLRLSSEETDEQTTANQGTRLGTGDQIVICSDGLTDLVEDREILNRLQGKDLEGALQQLINLANSRGGHDNITIVALRVPPKIKTEEARPPQEDLKKATKKKISWPIYVGIGVFALALIALGVVLIVYLSAPVVTPQPTETVVSVLETIQATVTPTEFPTPTATNTPVPSETPILETFTPWPSDTLEPSETLPQETDTPSPTETPQP